MLYTGIVENRYDPLKLGRCQVRIIGLHTHDKQKLPTADLPWAYPMQPITSAAMSGIGSTPLGLVEGTSVVILFQDPDKQYPIMIGSLGGIPQGGNNISVDDSTLVLKIDGELTKSNAQNDVIVDSSGNAIVDSSGAPITSTQPVATPDTLVNTNSIKRAAEFTPGPNCIALIKQFEGLRLDAYEDIKKIWTIGYGNTIINGQPVVKGMKITQAQAETYLLETLSKDHAASVKRNTRALITQSMFDALCCFTYNVGSSRFANSTLLKDLNGSKYLDAASGFLQYDKATIKGVLTSVEGLTRRRIAEKNLFLTEGIPNEAGELPPSDQTSAVATTTTTATTSTGAVQTHSSINGFVDPNNKYPLYISEPDTNRLARNEQINKTVVYKKEAGITKGVETAGGGTWDQSPNPYNATYPFNHVMMTESGHILEFDDSPNSERIHLYHKSGTFTEIDANGTQVNRIVGDGYEIYERNGYVHLNGSLNVTVDGVANVLVKNSLNLDVRGVANINVFNDVNLNVSGSLNASITESFKLKAASVIIEGGTVDIKSNGALTMSGSLDVNINSGGTLYADGLAVSIANGASNANASGLSTPADKQSAQLPEFNKLTVIARGSASDGAYETPEEGDSSQYVQTQINSGALKTEDINSGTQSPPVTAPANKVEPIAAGCDIINMTQVFNPSFRLSKNYKLSALTSGGSRMPVAQQGLTPQAIVCNLKGLCENYLEVVLNLYPNLVITSAFRRPGDVAASAAKSDHYLGTAVDIVIPNTGRQGHYDAIQKIQQLVPYDQLILEYSGATTVWIHASFAYSGARKQIFTMRDHHRIGDMGKFVLVT